MSKILISSGLSGQTKRVKFVFVDDEPLAFEEGQITVGSPAKFIIGNLGSSNSTLVENVTNVPSDYYGDKYDYDGGTWTKRSDWDDEIDNPSA